MASLKLLQSKYSNLDTDFLTFCATHGILTVQDFLIHDLRVLVAFAEQHPLSNRFKECINLVLLIIDEQHQPWLNGVEVLQDAEKNKHFLSTGLEEIDFLLHGGLRQGQLVELVGPSSSGKTQFCLQAASTIAMADTATVIYVDTGNSFSPQRILHLVGNFSDFAFNQGRSVSVEKVMSSIVCHAVFDMFEMLNLLHQLQLDLTSQVSRLSNQKLLLLVVDSISSLIAPILSANSCPGHALMASAGFLLKKLAHQHDIAILVTNHMVGGGGMAKPALGESWKSIPHVRLVLNRNDGENFKACILKHPFLATGETGMFGING